MMRPALKSLAAAGGLLLVSTIARAADGWPGITPGWEDRGNGGGLAILPLAVWWLVILAWIRTGDWLARDATQHKLSPAFWGTVIGLPLPLAAVLAWWIPSAWIGIPLMVLAWLVPVIVYAVNRNPKVATNERILTLGHARRIVAGLVAPLGIEISEPIAEEELLPTVELAAAGGKEQAENDARLAAAKALPGFDEATKTMLDAVVARASILMIDNAAESAIRYEVDGVKGRPKVRQPPKGWKEKETWVDAPPSSRAVGDAVSAVLKAVCGMPKGAKAAAGTFAIKVDGKLRNCRLAVRTGPAGEQLQIQVEAPAVTYKKFADLGMAEPVAKRMAELLAVDRGLLLLSSPAGSGLTTTFDLAVETADRLLRDFVSIEDAAQPPREIQNVKPFRFDARTGVTPVDALGQAMREYPRAVVTRDVRDKDLVTELARLAGDGQMVVLSLKAGDSIEAIGKILGCGVQPKQLAAVLVGSLSQRLVRRLCPKCREEIPPPEQFLARVRMTAEQLPHIYKASGANDCRLCQGSGFFGRTAVFELASGELIRRGIAAGAAADQLRQAAVKDGMRLLRDAGIQLVIDGVTSIEEVQRALAAPASGSAPASKAPASGRPAAPPPKRPAP
ncbi:MAG: hypothetical protein RLZZ440_449 [Planctomycetota bacterium]